MKYTKESIFLGLLVIFSLSLRLYIALQTETFEREAYPLLMQVEHIATRGTPQFYSELRFHSEIAFFPPLFHYILSFLSLFFPLTLVGKIVPNIIASFLPIIVYSLCLRLTSDKPASLFSAYLAAFLPAWFSTTINSVSVYSVALPLSFVVLLTFLLLKESRWYRWAYGVSLILLSFTHPIVIVVLLILLIYAIMSYLEKSPIDKLTLEILLSSILFVAWMELLIYKKALLAHGLDLIWQNIPPEILAGYFSSFSVLKAISFIGLVPFSLGVYALYRAVFFENHKEMLLMVACAVTIGSLLWLKLIPLGVGLMYTGIISVVFFAQFYVFLFEYIQRTRLARMATLFLGALFSITFLTVMIPALNYGIQSAYSGPSSEELLALEWVELNTPKEGIFAAAISDGDLLEYFSERRAIIDSNFLLSSDINERYLDIKTIYTTPSKTQAITLLDKYNIDYIYLSEQTKEDWDSIDIEYIDDPCFRLVYQSEVRIYQTQCALEVLSP